MTVLGEKRHHFTEATQLGYLDKGVLTGHSGVIDPPPGRCDNLERERYVRRQRPRQ